jgi:2,3-bisphosphoglycerate-independent phosphoglycerate mutase
MTADHGNAEKMIDPDTGEPHTAHTTNPVPFILINAGRRFLPKPETLGGVAPTILKLQGLPVPSEMTGEDLLDLGRP